MAKEISFSEFLKEGTFKKETAVVAELPAADKPIRIEPDTPASDKELKQFWKDVRHFFRTAERPKGVNGSLVPALLAPYIKTGNYTNDYPIYISEDGEDCIPLIDLIQNGFNDLFDEKQAKVLRANLPRIYRDFRNAAKKEKHFVKFNKAWEVTEKDLLGVDVHGDRKELYLKNINLLKEKLPSDGYVLRFSDEAGFLMLQLGLKQIASKRSVFISRVKKEVIALKELLEDEDNRITSKEIAKNEKGFGFAENLISFDKVGKMMPGQGTIGIGEVKKGRIEKTIEILNAGIAHWQKFTANLVITESLFTEYVWDEIFEGAAIKKAGINEGYENITSLFDERVVAFAQFMAAHRIAVLELNEKYVDDVHTDFFNHFSWHHLSSEEFMLFPPVIFIGETQGFLRHNLERFSRVLSLNKPFRILAVEKRLINDQNPEVSWEDASHGFRQELAAIAIAHRSTHTFQSALNKPVETYDGIKKCLEVDAPSIMHLLIPSSSEVSLIEMLKLTAAVEGRFFPSLTYDLGGVNKWGSRFDISENPFAESDWPEYELSFIDIDGAEKKQSLEFTYADYKAITKEKIEELMLIPESFKSDDLIHLAEFLKTPLAELTGKVPFIWLVNEDNCLKRAAIPYMWVVSSQERLDNWNYIQELGGVNSYHVSKALEEAKSKWQKENDKEIAEINEVHHNELQNTEAKAAGEAMERLTNVLLGLNDVPQIGTVLNKRKPIPKKEKIEPKKEANEVLPEPQKEETEVSSEAWLESFRCTSCNECTEKYPHIFKYNEDKQAELKENFEGKYMELVLAAEECPANCIHPGKPKNLNEVGLEEFMKRAEKYN